MSNKIFCLRNVDIYKNISEKEIDSIAQNAFELWHEQNEVIYSPENPPQKVYILKQGEVEIIREEGGKKVVIETLLPGDVFGNFGVDYADHSAITTRKSYFCETPTQEFLEIVRAHPEIALQLMQTMAARTHDYENRIACLSLPAKDQILCELRRIDYKNKNSFLGKIFPIPLRISHQKLADKTGLNRVTVTKIIGQLKREHLLEVDEKTGEFRFL